MAIAGFAFYAENRLKWEATKSWWITAAVVVYFVLNTLLTTWVWVVEAGEIFSGRRGKGESVCLPRRDKLSPCLMFHQHVPIVKLTYFYQIIVSSYGKKYSPLYKISVIYKSSPNEVSLDKEFEGSFTNWFSEDGVFHAESFQQWVASEVKVPGIGAGESKKTSKKRN